MASPSLAWLLVAQGLALLLCALAQSEGPPAESGLLVETGRRGPAEAASTVDELCLNDGGVCGIKIPDEPDIARNACGRGTYDQARWRGHQFICAIEKPEWALVRKWIDPDATVLEFGCRFGSTTCEIANKTRNQGRVTCVEPDTVVHDDLLQNLNENHCKATVLTGVVGPKSMDTIYGEYASRTVESNDPAKKKNSLTFHKLESETGLRYDTLLIDCEGCLPQIIGEIKHPIVSGQIKLVLFEADRPKIHGRRENLTESDCQEAHQVGEANICTDYDEFRDFLESNGFSMEDRFSDCDRDRSGAKEDDWCLAAIYHYAYVKR